MCSKLPIAQTILKPCRFSGRTQYSVATTAFSRFSVIAAALDDRAANLSNVYASYRIIGVTFTVVARETTEVNLAVYFNSPTATVPTTIGELQDFPFYAQGSGLYGSPLPSISIKKHELDKLRQVKWFNTQLSSADTEFEYQFEVYAYAPFATLNYVVRIEYMVEFDASTDPNLVMQGRDWRELQRKARAQSFGIDFERPPPTMVQMPRRADTPESKEEGNAHTYELVQTTAHPGVLLSPAVSGISQKLTVQSKARIPSKM